MATYVLIDEIKKLVTNGIIADDLETAQSFLGSKAVMVPDHVYPGCLYDAETQYFVSASRVDRDGNLYPDIIVEE